VPRTVHVGFVVDTNDTIHNRILLANRAYYGLGNLFTSRSVFRKTKCLLYKTLILPVALYASETWPLRKKNKIALNTFERKISRKMYGPIQENGIWRKRCNHELYNLYNDVEISKKAKISRMKWAGHVLRMNDEELTKKLMLGKSDGSTGNSANDALA
jgi:hypothetical protein